jgi:hypothetical protein
MDDDVSPGSSAWPVDGGENVDRILVRSNAKRCVSKDEATGLENALNSEFRCRRFPDIADA